MIVAHSFPRWLPQTQTWMHALVTSLPEEIVSHVFCNTTENLDQFRVPRIHEIGKLYPIGARLNRRLAKWLPALKVDYVRRLTDRFQPRVVHSHFGNIGARDAAQLGGLPVRHVVTFYGYDVTMLPQSRPAIVDSYARMFRSVDRVLCEGSHMAANVAGLGCPTGKIRVQHLGVDLDRFEYRPRKWNRSDPLRVLMAASFREKKGYVYGLTALSTLAQKVPVEITIVGDAGSSDADQREKHKILNAIERGPLSGRVRMLGYQPHNRMIEEAYCHHLFLAPSVHAEDGDSEGGAPVTLIEMAATGMPIISTQHCDIPEVVLHGVTGWLAPERDVDGILECFERAMDTSVWPDILHAGRDHIEREYCLKKQGRKLADIYHELDGQN